MNLPITIKYSLFLFQYLQTYILSIGNKVVDEVMSSKMQHCKI